MIPVVILAGGLATRIRPLTEKIPKSLIDIAGRPFIAYQLELLHRHGIREVLLCVGHLGEQIQAYVGNGQAFGLKVAYAFDGPAPLGTAGSIANALSQLPQHFFVLYGDSFLDCDYQAIQDFYLSQSKSALMTVLRNHNQWDQSNIIFNNGQILAYDKFNPSPDMHYIDYGLGVFDCDVFVELQRQGAYDLAKLYQDLLAQEQLAALEVKQRFYEVGSLSGIEEFTCLVKPF